MRQELLAGVTESTQVMRLKLEEDPTARFDDNDEFAISYSQLEGRPMFLGILLDALLRQLAWPWPFEQTRADFVCSIIDWMCVTEKVAAVTECGAMLLVASFAAVYEEVATSEAVLQRLDKIAVLSVKRLQTVEGVQAGIYLTRAGRYAYSRCTMCLAACFVDKTGCCAALREIQASTAIAKRLLHTSRIELEEEDVEDVGSSNSFNTYGEEFRLLMLLVGLLGAHDEQILCGFKRTLDADLLATALSASLASQEAGEHIWLPLDSRGIFDLVEAAVFTAPTKIEDVAEDVAEVRELEEAAEGANKAD
eukprot:IDg17872t1